ncbi:MAG TPA: hypothetical protein VN442_14935 [Bryobacteraceae bacterium]|nr:hypothetical protein [Bryobacteraceae bacterium]
MLRLLVIVASCALLPGQTSFGGVPAKDSAAAYSAHARAGRLEIGAEYLVRSIAGRRGIFFVKDYLVVEVAVFPPRGGTTEVTAGAFTLLMNGKKRPILPQSPGFVAASLKYPEWREGPRLEAVAGAGNAGVILGRPDPVERFPGDPNATSRVPRPPRAPEPENPGGIDRQREATADEVAVASALPEGPARLPVAGYLYFPYSAKTKSIKSLELLYSGPEGDAALKVR